MVRLAPPAAAHLTGTVDEWPDAASFLRFFEDGTDIGEMMGEAGVTERPTPVFWRELDTADKF